MRRGAREDQNVTRGTEPPERGKVEPGEPGGEAVRFTLIRSCAPQVRSSVAPAWFTRWSRTWAFLPPAVV